MRVSAPDHTLVFHYLIYSWIKGLKICRLQTCFPERLKGLHMMQLKNLPTVVFPWAILPSHSGDSRLLFCHKLKEGSKAMTL